jgi:hypothetical protein
MVRFGVDCVGGQFMARKVAPPKVTAGSGFTFEDDVCAWLLACMLTGDLVFGPDFGPPVQLEFQTRPAWLLDDVLVTTATKTSSHRFALSVKSNTQFTARKAPADFVKDAWEQWLHVESKVFDHKADFMGLVTNQLPGTVKASVDGLIKNAGLADPKSFPSRLREPRWANENQRSLFASFTCPTPLAVQYNVTEEDTARLLQRLHFRQHDFGEFASGSQNAALKLCRSALRSGKQDDAETLWEALRALASEFRPGGSLTLSALVDRLRRRFFLADYPDHAADWLALERQSQQTAMMVSTSIAGRIHVPRDESIKALQDVVASHEMVALLGASGIGKSAIARALFDLRKAADERTLWIDAGAFECASFAAFSAEAPWAPRESQNPGPRRQECRGGRRYRHQWLGRGVQHCRLVLGRRNQPRPGWPHACKVCLPAGGVARRLPACCYSCGGPG